MSPSDPHHHESATDARQPELRHAGLGAVEMRELPRPDMVTAVIRQQVQADHVDAYEAWLHRIIPIAARFPGHRGTHVLRPAGDSAAYTVTIHFDTLSHADDWFRSDARAALLREVEPLLAGFEEVRTITGLEFWFDPPTAMPAPRRAKQALATLSVIYPLTTVLGLLISPLFSGAPWPWGRVCANLLVSTASVALLTYVIMPRYARLISRWLSR